jgi:hypothetical protein
LLCDFVGANLRQLDNELEKLSLYACNRPITPQDVRAMVADASEEQVWGYRAALRPSASRPKPWRGGQDLAPQRPEPDPPVSLIARQYRHAVEIKSLAATGVSTPAEMARQLGYSPYPVQKALPLTSQYAFAELEAILDRLLTVDMAMKTGSDPDTSSTCLLAELVGFYRQPVVLTCMLLSRLTLHHIPQLPASGAEFRHAAHPAARPKRPGQDQSARGDLMLATSKAVHGRPGARDRRWRADEEPIPDCRIAGGVHQDGRASSSSRCC